MSEYTSIQIGKDIKQKLDLCKGINNNSYNTIIAKLLEQSGGVIVEDVVEIQREQVAFTLKYFDNNDNNKIRDITYLELANAKVGEVFTVIDYPVGEGWLNSKATVLVKDGYTVILLVEEFDENSCIKTVVHVELF